MSIVFYAFLGIAGLALYTAFFLWAFKKIKSIDFGIEKSNDGLYALYEIIVKEVTGQSRVG